MLYKLMKAFFQISESFFEQTTIFEREDFGLLVKVWEWSVFCATCSDAESSVLCCL